MRAKILIGAAVTFGSLVLGTVSAGANNNPPPFQCNRTVNGGTINGNVQVPASGVCVLNGVTVNGSVTAADNSYFESNGSTIAGNVTGNGAQTLYVWNHSVVGANIAGYQTPQVFVYNSTVGQSVGGASSAAPGYGHFQVCGSTIGQSVAVYQMGPDILVGDPAASCGANTVKGAGILVYSNTADNEVYVIGNVLPSGSISVTSNTGGGDKRVNANNLPKGTLDCSGNSQPFNGSGNIAHKFAGGQCTA